MPDRFLGQRLGDYITEERIGRGAMAIVYRAYQPSVQRQVALKIIKLDAGLGDDDEFRRRFAQEAELIAALEHIHILPVFDYGLAEGEVAYIAMRLLRGGTLADLIKNGPLPLERAADIITQVARGLAYAHRHGVIHRDLKPSNILFDLSGNAYLSDFGLAKVLATPDMTRPGNLVGTPAYVAPEALRGEVVDHRADVYSLGILAYETLTGRLPFEAQGGNILSLIRMHLEDEPPSMRAINPDIPAEVEAVIMRALRKDPDLRYDDTEQMAIALNTALGRQWTTGTYTAIRPSPDTVRKRPLRRLSRRARAMLTLGALALLLLCGIAVVRVAPGLVAAMAHYRLLDGVRGTAADVRPSAADLELARARLGSDGFIAFIACTMDSAFQVTRAREMGEMATQQGLNYRVYDSGNDAREQMLRIDQALAEGAQALILCPLDAERLKPRLAELRDAGLPVVIITLFEHGFGLMLDTDNYRIGRAAGRLAGEIAREEFGGRADVLFLGYPGFPAPELRIDGMREGLLDLAPSASLLGVRQGFTRQDGYESVRAALGEGLKFNLILSMNDAGSFGAIDALTEAGIGPDQVAIVSVNAEPLAIEYIRQGQYLRGSVAIDRRKGSEIALNAAARMLAGAAVPETILFEPGEVVTRESLIGA